MSISERINLLEEKILNTCIRSGRKRCEIEVMGVSKNHSIEEVKEAYDKGIYLFGENRFQEAIKKFENNDIRKKIKLHFIGNLQRNKAKKAAAFFDCIQSLDRDNLIDELAILTYGREEPLMVLLEYHTGEESKAGYRSKDDVFKAVEKLLSCPGLKIDGLMTMAPFTDEQKLLRAAFKSCFKMREEVSKSFNLHMPCLSMGMTQDFEIAIEEGATLLRIGSGIFGEA